MKTRVAYCIALATVFCGSTEIAIPQNLVPNWSFEEHTDSCSNYYPFGNLTDWYPRYWGTYPACGTCGTPDYYSACMNYIYPVMVPPHLGVNGFQYPKNQESFVGIACWANGGPGMMDNESFRIKLKEPLKANVCYHGEFYCNLANNVGFVNNKLGMALTVDSFTMNCTGYLPNPYPYPTPQIYTNTFIYDTLNWIKVEGNFNAYGGEEWLTIGWMFDSDQISFMPTNFGIPGYDYVYYYIDALQVYACIPEEEIILPQFISPNGDGKNDFYVIDSLPPNSKATFFNRWGNEVYHSDNYQNEWNGMYLGHLLPVGTYFVVVQMPYGTKKTTFVELMY